MYNRITTKSGIAAVTQFRDSFPVVAAVDNPDGLTFASNDGGGYITGQLAVPDRLMQFLVDVRLMRNIPVAYLVPDAALLPPESIRFFQVDTTWLDRVVDGVFSAANTGTVDAVYSASFLKAVRTAVDTELGLANDTRITGMLIRSELVRRWPKMIVRAYSTEVTQASLQASGASAEPESTVPVLRAEPISKDLYLALFAGEPKSIHVREPFVGVRFGIEEQQNKTWRVDKRKNTGENLGGSYTVAARPIGSRTLDITGLVNQLAAADRTPRMVALSLEQRPYVQVFRGSQGEPKGSVAQSSLFLPNGTWQGPVLRNGRPISLQSLAARLPVQNIVKEKP